MIEQTMEFVVQLTRSKGGKTRTKVRIKYAQQPQPTTNNLTNNFFRSRTFTLLFNVNQFLDSNYYNLMYCIECRVQNRKFKL